MMMVVGGHVGDRWLLNNLVPPSKRRGRVGSLRFHLRASLEQWLSWKVSYARSWRGFGR